MRKACSIFLFLIIPVLLFSEALLADTITEFLNNARKYYDEEKYAKALEELEWAKKELSNLHMKKMMTFLPENMEGYTQEDVSGGNVMGMQGLTREYTHNDTSNTVEIMIFSGSQAGGTSGLGALMGFAGLAASMDGSLDSQVVTTKGNRGNLVYNGTNKETVLTYNLPSNVVITITTQGFESGDTAKSFAEKINFDGLKKEFE